MKNQDRARNYELARMHMEQSIGKPINHEMIKNLHTIVMGSSEVIGYRKMGACVRNEFSGEKRYLAPDPFSYDIQMLMDKLLLSYDQPLSKIEKAARIHWGMVKIHPFQDGNGRTARLLTLLVLRNNGYTDLDCQRLEEYFQAHRKLYDDSLDDGNVSFQNFDNVSLNFIRFLQEGLKQNP
ncbi:MAG TPA: Fic family protein [Candidatus Babeliales bacterium]|nr:Fic family protein [Candidatus Babeliales bacterium]